MAKSVSRKGHLSIHGDSNMDTEEAKNNYDYIRFTYADFHGLPCCKLVPRSEFDAAFENGIGIFAGSLFIGLRGELLPNEESEGPGRTVPSLLGNVALVPQPHTLMPVPWAGGKLKYKVGQVLCETRFMESKLPQEECPRYIARRQLHRLADIGYQLYSGFEVEVVLRKGDEPVFKSRGLHENALWNKHEELFLDVDASLQKMGFRFQAHHLEYCSGQFEMVLAPSEGIKSADAVFVCKDAVREIIDQHSDDLEAVFTSSLDKDGAYRNALQFSCSLIDGNGDNVMYDTNSGSGLSPVAEHWLGGITKHAGAIVALCCPTVNCYRRLHHSRTPNTANWGIDDREVTFRVKRSPKNTNIECRIPGGSANPYLVMAAVTAAGVDGIINQIVCPPTKDDNADILPKSLSEALEQLEKDAVIVDALGRDFIDKFIRLKKHKEISVLGDCIANLDLTSSEWEMYGHL